MTHRTIAQLERENKYLKEQFAAIGLTPPRVSISSLQQIILLKDRQYEELEDAFNRFKNETAPLQERLRRAEFARDQFQSRMEIAEQILNEKWPDWKRRGLRPVPPKV